MKRAHRLIWSLSALALATAFVVTLGPTVFAAEKVLRLPMRSGGPGSLDPVLGSTTYDNRAISMVYEGLLQYAYLERPLELEPLLLASMPEISEDGRTYRFELKQGVRFQDDPCFPGGKGRELVARDVFYSWKRMADPANEARGWWIFEGAIAGFDDWRAAQSAAVAAGGSFDYDAPVPGLRILDEHTFEVELARPVYRFMWTLAMFQTSIVPREAVEEYGTRFGRHPVGTGPFRLREGDWIQSKSLVFTRNPTYREDFYPSASEAAPGDAEAGLTEAAGERLPFADRVEFTMFVQEQPMWLEFRSGKLDYTHVPAENFLEAFHKRSKKLRKEYAEQGVVAHAIPLLDMIFRGMNMEDPVLGGYTQEKRWLRQAISLAIDLEEFNDTFYNGINVVYDGMIPPGLDGHPEGGRGPVSLMGPDLERARELLAKAGYPGGEGLKPIDYYVSRAGNGLEQSEMMKRQLGELGIELNVRMVLFAQLMEVINQKKAPLFSFAWHSDYPDGENNLALFYGPNEAPGSNFTNYKNAEYDELYRKAVAMAPGSERTKLYGEMRDMVVADVPFVGSMARTRMYALNPWLKNYKPTEDFYNWVKYLDVDESKRTP